MKIQEFDPEYIDPNQDTVMKRHFTDNRKSKITLKDLNRLKKMRAAHDLETLMRGDFLEIIYGTPDDAASGGGLGI
jgi:hypothetical protein